MASVELPSIGPRVTSSDRNALWRAPRTPSRTISPVRGPSVRTFSKPLLANEIADAIERNYEASPRPLPSAGATYGLSFVILDDGGGAPLAGVAVHQVACDQLRRREVVFNVLDGHFSLVVASADMRRYTGSYGRRGERYAAIEAGHFAQLFLMDAYRNGWIACPVGGFHDHAVASLCREHVPDGAVPLYLIGVGLAE